MKHFKLAVKLLLREIKQGELTLLLVAVIIAIGSLSSIGFLTKRVELSIQTHAARLSGGALILKSPTSIPKSWLRQAKNMQLESAVMVSFPSMLSLGDEFQLSQIKAVSDNFPLQGELTTKNISGRTVSTEPTLQTQAPPAGHIWIAPRLWHSFNGKFTDDFSGNDPLLLELGETSLRIAGVLENIPGQSSGTLFSIAPSALINLADLEKTATLQLGSRVDYLYFFSPVTPNRDTAQGEKNIADYKDWIEQRLLPGQSIKAGAEGVRAINTNLQKAGQFLSLASLLSVMLAAIAIVISSHQYAVRQNKNHAIFICLGCKQNSIFKMSLYKLLLLGLTASVIGVLTGYLVQAVLLNTLQELIPKPLPPVSPLPAISGLLAGMLLIISVFMANLLRSRDITPIAIMRNELASVQTSRLLLYGFTLSGLFIISLWTTQDLNLSLWFYTSFMITAVIFYLLAKILLIIFLGLSRGNGLINRLSWINIQRHQQHILLQISTFSLIFALVMLLYLLRTELLDNWQQQLPTGTPNHFVINLQDDETQAFQQFLAQFEVRTAGIYPMIRGRLYQLNEQPVKQAIPEQARNHNALNRELNLSFAMDKEADQALLAGQWWNEQTLEKSLLPLLSIESSLANALGVKLGDQLGFQIGSENIKGVVSNIRQVKWDSFKPNFYIIFSPGIIENYPMTYISSFYLPAEQKNSLNTLMKNFPGITIIEVDKILQEIQFIIEKISLAIELVFVFILFAGFLVLASSLNSTLEIRRYENAILRTLGASARMIRRSLTIEFIVIAVLSAIIGVLIAEAAGAILYQRIFNLSYTLHPQLWLAVIIIAVLLITTSGLLMMNKLLTQTALQSLNKYG